MANRQTVNVRRLLAVIVTLIVLVVLAGAGYVYRTHRVAANFRRMRAQGLAAHVAGDRVTSVNLLGQYLARDPNDLEVLVAFAADRPLVLLPNNQNLAQAIQSLRYALRLDPSLVEQRRQLMHLYTQTGYATEALDAADAVLASKPGDADALAARTGALARLRRLPDALVAAVAWCDADPAAVDARLARLELLQQTQHPEAEVVPLADGWADRWPTPAPSSKPSLMPTSVPTAMPAVAGVPRPGGAGDGTPDLLRGHARLAYGDAAAIPPLTSSAAAAAVHPPSRVAGVALARDLDAVRQPDLARTVLQALAAANPADLDLRIDLARRDWEAQQFRAVIDVLAGVTDRSLIPSRTLGLEAVSLTQVGRKADAEPIRQALLARAGGTDGDPTAAAWAAIVGQMANDHFDAAAAVAACRPVLDRADDPLLRYFLGEAYARLGERDLAARQWQRVVSDDLSWAEPATRLCRLLTEAGRPDAGLTAGYEAARRAPHDAEALVALAGAWVATIQAGHGSDPDGCLALVEQLARGLPADGRLPPLHAALLAALNRPADAAAVIRVALDGKQTYPPETWEKLAAISQASKLKLEAPCLARGQRDDGLTPTLAYAKAAARFADGRPADGLASYDADRRAAGPATSADALNWDLDRAVYLDLIHDASAATVWRTLCDANPDDLHVQQTALAALSVRSDRDAMGRAVDRLGRLTDRQGAGYPLARARWLVNYGSAPEQADEARHLLDDVLRQSPESVDAHILSARSYEVAGHPADAAADLRAAADLMPSAASIRLSLARLLQTQGDFDGARDQLANVNAEQLAGGEQRRQAAVLLAQQGQSDRAIALLEEEARAGAESTTAQLTLATLYLRNNDQGRAEAIFHRLLADHPDAAVIQFGADLLARTGHLPEARQVLDRLSDPRTAGTGNGVAELTRGDFDFRYDSATPEGRDAALGQFAAATTAGPTNFVTWRARVAVELLTGHPDKALAVAAEGLRHVPGDPTLAAVQRQSAEVAYAATQEDLRPMLVPFLRDPLGTSAAAKTLDVVYNARTADQSALLATRLRDLADQFPRFWPLHLYLIQLDEKLGRLDDAAAIAARAVQALPEDPEPLRVESALLAKQDSWPEALAVSTRWHDGFPADALPADAAVANALVHLNRPGDALARLQQYADHPGTPAYDQVLPLLARARQAAGQTDSATLMEPLLAKGPAGRLSWMLFAVTSLPPAEAETWIRRAVDAMPSPTSDERVRASEMYVHLADRCTGPEAARFAAAALDVLRPALAVDHPSTVVLQAAGSRNEGLGDTAAAADLYRRALAVAPDQPVALNNLSMILTHDGHADQAVGLIAAALAAVPDVPQYRTFRASLFDTQAVVLSHVDNRLDDALTSIADALRLDPARVSLHVRRITLLADANRPREAADALHDFDALQLDVGAATAETQAALRDLRRRLSKATATTAPGVTTVAAPE